METEIKKEKKEKIPRQKMPEQNPGVRITNFEEVPLGYSEETAILEAKRCIQCKKPGCIAGCPVEVRIPEFIQAIADGNFIEAAHILKETNSLPAVCGRVCPQEEQCEQVCILGKKGDVVVFECPYAIFGNGAGNSGRRKITERLFHCRVRGG